MTARAIVDAALEQARRAAYPEGEFVGQESFVTASGMLALASRAGIGPGTRVVDVCCGLGGIGRHVTARLACSYVGIDSSTEAIEITRARAAASGLPCRYVAATVPPLPAGRFDVALLIETFLAFPDKATLVGAVAAGLAPGGRFAFTLEEGDPLTSAEAAAMPAADTVWPIRWPQLEKLLDAAGFDLLDCRDETAHHVEIVDALTTQFTAHRGGIAAATGDRFIDDLVAAHRLWSHWMHAGRIRKLAVTARRR